MAPDSHASNTPCLSGVCSLGFVLWLVLDYICLACLVGSCRSLVLQSFVIGGFSTLVVACVVVAFVCGVELIIGRSTRSPTPRRSLLPPLPRRKRRILWSVPLSHTPQPPATPFLHCIVFRCIFFLQCSLCPVLTCTSPGSDVVLHNTSLPRDGALLHLLCVPCGDVFLRVCVACDHG